jgi:hypothetical protein
MSVDRIIADGFYLPALPGELEQLTKYPKDAAATKRKLEGCLRVALQTQKRWPSDSAGRIALVLWLMSRTNRDAVKGVRLYHQHEKIKLPGQATKPTGTLIRAGLGRVSSGT